MWARSSLTHYYPANLSHWDPEEAEDFLGLHIEPNRRETISNMSCPSPSCDNTRVRPHFAMQSSALVLECMTTQGSSSLLSPRKLKPAASMSTQPVSPEDWEKGRPSNLGNSSCLHTWIISAIAWGGGGDGTRVAMCTQWNPKAIFAPSLQAK